jgi:hypothetical protein
MSQEMNMPRHDLDQYETPTPLVLALKERVYVVNSRKVFECCAGDLAIARHFPGCFTNDIDPSCDTDLHLDMTMPGSWSHPEIPEVDWVITNPPFSLAEKILPLAFERASVGVMFLLRLSYQEPTKDRADWLEENKKYLSNLIIFNPRPRFGLSKHGKPASDSVTVAWMVWRRPRAWWGWTKVAYVTGWDPDRRKHAK